MSENTAEFTLPQQYKTDRSSPARWIFSHAIHQWPIVLIALAGALGNAGLLAIIQVKVGEAFNLVSASQFENKALIAATMVILACSIGRGVLQFSRNFGFEFIAQRV